MKSLFGLFFLAIFVINCASAPKPKPELTPLEKAEIERKREYRAYEKAREREARAHEAHRLARVRAEKARTDEAGLRRAEAVNLKKAAASQEAVAEKLDPTPPKAITFSVFLQLQRLQDERGPYWHVQAAQTECNRLGVGIQDKDESLVLLLDDRPTQSWVTTPLPPVCCLVVETDIMPDGSIAEIRDPRRVPCKDLGFFPP
ncbi:hypothetical protein GF366_03650 [Candidatus Peregrinibacteria bacterium]|nr:hypothetical protein [Candidatus Peregrinibacteria bacterium]